MNRLSASFPAAASVAAPSYGSNGYVLWQPFLSCTGLAFLRQQVDRVLALTHESISTEWIMNIHLLGETWLLDFAMEQHLLDAVQGFCGPDITLLQTHLFCKPRGCPPTPWHQDGSSDTDIPLATVWITLDDLVAPSSGALLVLPGQHRLNLLPSEASDHFQFDRVLPPAYVAHHTPFRYALQAGDAAVHHQWLPHASEDNLALPYRRVIVLRYMATSVLEAEGVALHRLSPDHSLVPVQSLDHGGGTSDEGELYPDFRSANVLFEGRNLCVRGKYT